MICIFPVRLLIDGLPEVSPRIWVMLFFCNSKPTHAHVPISCIYSHCAPFQMCNLISVT